MFLPVCKNGVRTLLRCYCSQANLENANASLNSHPYCIPPFKSYAELTSLLSKNVIYKSNGLLIVNRPYGLRKDKPIERGFWLKKIKLNVPPALQAIDELTFVGILSRLKKELKVKQLELLKTPDRYMSGVSILTYNEKLVSKAVSRALLPPHLPKYTYLAVCEGIPFVDSKSVKLGITLLERGSSRKVTFVQNYSKRAMISGKVYPFAVNHQVLAVNEKLRVSLVRLECTKNKWNALRGYCAMRLLTPALGDSIFAPYVQEINKTKIAVDPFSAAANKPYKLSQCILDALNVPPKQLSIIPLHIHLAKLNFLKYKPDGKIFTAKPPDHFLWTCEKLELTIPEEYLNNCFSEELATTDAPAVVQVEDENNSEGDNENVQSPRTDDYYSEPDRICS